MTRPLLCYTRCKLCGSPAACVNCGVTATSTSRFSDWLRALPGPYDSTRYDNENLDYIWFNYREGWLITMEEKQNGAASHAAQRDTHGIIRQMLKAGSKEAVQTWRGLRRIDYRGHYEVSFEHSCPTDSAWIRINGAETDEDGLMTLLSTGSILKKHVK